MSMKSHEKLRPPHGLAQRTQRVALIAACCASLAVSSVAAQDAGTKAGAPGAKVDSAFVVANEATTQEWPSVGLDYAEARFSKLKQIDTGNVKDLGLVWSYDLEALRGVEATPLVVDGVMYTSSAWSVVHAIDARTGKRLWSHDPGVDRSTLYKGCCDGVNRGVAVYQGRVYAGVYDGRLIALDAATGKLVWEKDTIIDRKYSYTITGAVRVYKGKVIIGNGGAEFGARGYITAYDAATGEQKWRWFTVPGDPSKPFENEAMAKAAKTWDPAGRWWEAGGGGTVWDTMTFDPELNLMYIGTGNGSPWARNKRSPAGGDNLYLASIVALNPDTGEYAWHYQETPGDNWDFTSTQPMILADIQIDGKPRKVILHAPKNGFFFVIDRTNGQFISAKNFVPVNWTTGYDEKGRPVETELARDSERSREIIPSVYGAKSWHPMSYNPQTGLVYLPAQSIPLALKDNKDWKFNHASAMEANSNLGWNLSMFLHAAPPESKPFGRLLAWDPIAQKERWRVEHISPWNGGTLTTAGNLVFQGTADARFVAYDARDGSKLWESLAGAGIVAAPMTYELDGKQYVTIPVGWGGVYGLMNRHTDRKTPGALYTFAIDGKAKMPDFVTLPNGPLLSGVEYDPKDVEPGLAIYVSNCALCHGTPGLEAGGNIPNLGYMDKAFIDNLGTFLFKGPAMARGMPDFTGRLTEADVGKLKAFIQGTVDSIRKAKEDQ